MSVYLKRGATAQANATQERSVRDTVEAILADVAARGDDAVRELSIKFDQWDRESYRLTPSEIQQCIDHLPEDMRSVVVMSDVMGMDYAEIAASTGAALGTVKSRLSRARARMRDCLRQNVWELLPATFRLEEETSDL